MDYIGIATRSYGEGRITISADRLSAWRSSNYGEGFWRSMFEWVGQRKHPENIKIAIIDSIGVYPVDSIRSINPVSYTSTTIDVIAKIDISDLLSFDVIYFIGVPESITEEIKAKIAIYVNLGGGVHIETPNIIGEIEIISGIESINVEAINPPFATAGYWTEKSVSHPARQKDLNFSILVSLAVDEFDDNWDILISNVPTNYGTEILNEQQLTKSGFTYSSSFIATAGVYFKDGVVLVEENEVGSSESSSSDSSLSSESSSETSMSAEVDELSRPWTNEYTELVSANGVALWNLVTDGIATNPIINDAFKNLYNMAILKKDGIPSNTISHIVPLTGGSTQTEGVEYNLMFNGTDMCAETISSEFLNLNEFSVSLWVKYSQLKECVFICKSGVWEIGMNSPFSIYIKRRGFYKHSTYDVDIAKDTWMHLVVNADSSGSAEIYVNSVLCACVITDDPFDELNPDVSSVVIGAAGIIEGKFFQGEMSKIIVLNRTVSLDEVETLNSYTTTINPRPLEDQSILEQLTS